MSVDTEHEICQLRATHPFWGPVSIAHALKGAGVEPVPARSSIYRALVRNRLISPRPRQRWKNYTRWERATAMELWQMDVMGAVRLADGTEIKIVTAIR